MWNLQRQIFDGSQNINTINSKNQRRTDMTWRCSSRSHKLSLTSESTPPSISISSSDLFEWVGLVFSRTRSHNTSRSFFLAGVAPSALNFFQLIVLFRSAIDHLSTSFDASKVISSLVCCLLSLWSCILFLYIPSRLTCAASFLSRCTSRMVWPSFE